MPGDGGDVPDGAAAGLDWGSFLTDSVNWPHCDII